jgi:hypothetical protein
MERKDRRDYIKLSELAKQLGLYRYVIAEHLLEIFSLYENNCIIAFGALTLQPNVWQSCGLQQSTFGKLQS